jgi:hypothetical protein
MGDRVLRSSTHAAITSSPAYLGFGVSDII